MAKKSSRKTNRLQLYLALGFLILAILFVGSLYAAYHPKLLISQITVTGNKTVSDLEIRQVIDEQLAGKYFWLYPKLNAMLFPRDQVIMAVAKAFPRLSSITLEQPNLQSLTLSVKERRGEFLWCLLDNNCYFADETGFVFTPAPKFSGPLYFEFFSASAASPIGQRPLPLADWRKLVWVEKQITNILASSSLRDYRAYRARPAELRDWYFQVRNNLSNDWEIKLDLNQDFDLALKTLTSILIDSEFVKDWETKQAKLEYIDLRFAPKVFYRYNNQ